MDKKPPIDLAELFRKGMGQCPSTDELFSYFESGTADSATEHHVKYCPLCRKEFETIKSEAPSFLSSQAGELAGKQKKPESPRNLAYRFIKKYFPEELDLFDTAWRVFKDILPADLEQEAIAGALGAVGREPSDIVTPKAIIVINQLNKEDYETLTEEQLRETINRICHEIGYPQELVEQFIEFLSANFQK